MESKETVKTDFRIARSGTSWFKGCKKDENHCNCCKLAEKVQSEKCEHCNEIFDSVSQTKLHMHQAHEQSNQVDFIQCEKCSFQTLSKAGFSKHTKSHDDNLKMKKCFYCDFKSTDKTTRATHMNKAHHWLRCNVCDFKTKRPKLLEKHDSIPHDESLTMMKCPHCEFESYTLKKLKKHKKSMHVIKDLHPQNSAENECDVKQEKNAPKLKTNPVKCKWCENVAKDDQEAKVHIENSHKGDLLQCKRCSFQTISERNLVNHQKGHGASLNICQVCGFKSNRIRAFRTHSCEVFQCDSCEFSTHGRQGFNIHKLNAHPPPKDEDGLFLCELCSYKSKRKENVGAHKKTVHDGLRIVCQHCAKRFIQKSDFKRHLETAHIEFANE